MSQDYHDLLQGGGGYGAPTPPGFKRTLASREYPTLTAYSAGTHQDQHSVVVDYDVFENVKHLDAKDVKTIQTLYKPEDFDFRLKPGSAAVDKGVVIPQVTDGYAGAAPDLGALELGQPLPHYGPRDN
jgi:hypothetical protein